MTEPTAPNPTVSIATESTAGSVAGLLVLHAVRLKGFADERGVARRYGLDQAEVAEVLLDFQAFGWVSWSEFAGSGGWALTEAGRAENERHLASELERVDGRVAVQLACREFLLLNARLQQACTDWQLRPTVADALAFNDHSDSAWDATVIRELVALAEGLRPIAAKLQGVLERFRGYDTRFVAALGRVQAGDTTWVDRTDADSCHTVWFELHEDLIATLGLSRATS